MSFADPYESELFKLAWDSTGSSEEARLRRLFEGVLQEDSDGEGGYLGNGLTKAERLLEQCQERELDDLEDDILRYIRRVEDARDEVVLSTDWAAQYRRELQVVRRVQGDLQDAACIRAAKRWLSALPSEDRVTDLVAYQHSGIAATASALEVLRRIDGFETRVDQPLLTLYQRVDNTSVDNRFFRDLFRVIEKAIAAAEMGDVRDVERRCTTYLETLAAVNTALVPFGGLVLRCGGDSALLALLEKPVSELLATEVVDVGRLVDHLDAFLLLCDQTEQRVGLLQHDFDTLVVPHLEKVRGIEENFGSFCKVWMTPDFSAWMKSDRFVWQRCHADIDKLERLVRVVSLRCTNILSVDPELLRVCLDTLGLQTRKTYEQKFGGKLKDQAIEANFDRISELRGKVLLALLASEHCDVDQVQRCCAELTAIPGPWDKRRESREAAERERDRQLQIDGIKHEIDGVWATAIPRPWVVLCHRVVGGACKGVLLGSSYAEVRALYDAFCHAATDEPLFSLILDALRNDPTRVLAIMAHLEHNPTNCTWMVAQGVVDIVHKAPFAYQGNIECAAYLQWKVWVPSFLGSRWAEVHVHFHGTTVRVPAVRFCHIKDPVAAAVSASAVDMASVEIPGRYAHGVVRAIVDHNLNKSL